MSDLDVEEVMQFGEALYDSEEERQRLWEESHWTDREMFDFASAVQRYGFNDTKKIAKAVKTKSAYAVDALINQEVGKKSREMFGHEIWKMNGNFHSRYPKEGTAESWSALRKWQKIAQNQQSYKTRKVDYSCMIIPEIWEQFCSEAKSPLDPQEIDVPAIYRFINECVHGRAPPDLPPKESATMLLLMQVVKDMIQKLDFQEEIEFVQKFTKATSFLPLVDQDTSMQEPVSNEPPPADAVFVPRKAHDLLKEHFRLVQSFNPLTVPPWLLEKEQKQLHLMFPDEPPAT